MRHHRARPPRPVTQAALEATALWHLARRALTERQLRDILERKIARAARAGAPPSPTIDVRAVLDKMLRLGFIDDERVAAARAASMRSRGASARKIAHTLRRQGVAVDVVDTVNADADDLAAARAYARRRRLFDKERTRALAALARQGFSFDVARRALDDPDGADDARR